MKNKLKYLLFGLLTLVSFGPLTIHAFTFDNYESKIYAPGGYRFFYDKKRIDYRCTNYSLGSSEDVVFKAYAGSYSDRTVGLPSGMPCGDEYKFFRSDSFLRLKKGNLVDSLIYIYYDTTKKLDGKYIISSKSINIPKNGLLKSLWRGKTRDFNGFVPNSFGYTLINTEKAGIIELMSSVGGEDFPNLYIKIEGSGIAVYDVKKGRKYFWNNPFNVYEEFVAGGYKVPNLIKTVVPDLVQEATFSTTEGEDIFLKPNNSSHHEGGQGVPVMLGVSLGKVLASTAVELETGDSEDNQNNSDNQSNQNNSNNQSNPEQQRNQCIAKYTNMRALTAHSDGCFGKDYNNEERMKYWANVIDDDDAGYTARDKTRYRRCYMFANYKSGLKKKLGEARDPFRKEWKSEYLGLEAKDVNPELLCGSKPSSLTGASPSLVNSLKGIWASRGEFVGKKDGLDVSKLLFENSLSKYILYKEACIKKKYLPTKYDGNWLAHITYYDYFLKDKNNENVCRFALYLENNLKSKYGNVSFSLDYVKSFNSDFKYKSNSGSEKNLFNGSGNIDFLALSGAIADLNDAGDPSDPLDPSKLFEYFAKDYKDGVDKAFSVSGYKNCGTGIGIKEWDYLIWLPVFFILLFVLKGSL